MSAPLLVLTTFADAPAAEAAVRALVNERLAACGTLIPGAVSIYRWKEAVERADEVVVVLKTRPALWGSLRDRLRALHPYETPEIVALPASDAGAAYAAWVNEATDGPA